LLISAYRDIRYEVLESQTQTTPQFRPTPGLTLRDQVREGLRSARCAYRPEQRYRPWLLRSLRYVGGKTHPTMHGAQEMERLVSPLTIAGQVSASTQRQALNALVLLDRDVLHTPLASPIAPVRRQP
jgi:hypothetical protein